MSIKNMPSIITAQHITGLTAHGKVNGTTFLYGQAEADYVHSYDSSIYKVTNKAAAEAVSTQTKDALFIWTDSLGYSLRSKVGTWHHSDETNVVAIHEQLVRFMAKPYANGSQIDYNWMYFTDAQCFYNANTQYPLHYDSSKPKTSFGLNGHRFMGEVMETIFILPNNEVLVIENVNTRYKSLTGHSIETPMEFYFENNVFPSWEEHHMEDGITEEDHVVYLPTFPVFCAGINSVNELSVREYFLLLEHIIGFQKQNAYDVIPSVKDYLGDKDNETRDRYYETPLGSLEYALWSLLDNGNYASNKHDYVEQAKIVPDDTPVRGTLERCDNGVWQFPIVGIDYWSPIQVGQERSIRNYFDHYNSNPSTNIYYSHYTQAIINKVNEINIVTTRTDSNGRQGSYATSNNTRWYYVEAYPGTTKVVLEGDYVGIRRIHGYIDFIYL